MRQIKKYIAQVVNAIDFKQALKYTSSGKAGVSLAKIFITLLTTPKGISALATLGIMISQLDIITEIASSTALGTTNCLKKILK